MADEYPITTEEARKAGQAWAQKYWSNFRGWDDHELKIKTRRYDHTPVVHPDDPFKPGRVVGVVVTIKHGNKTGRLDYARVLEDGQPKLELMTVQWEVDGA